MTHSQIFNITFWADLLFRLSFMVLLGLLIARFAALFEKRDGRKRPRGVTLFCVLLILGSIYKLWGFLNYNYYRLMFQQFSEQAIFMRYCFSITLRLVGLVIAVGVLLLKNGFRRALVGLSLFTLCFLYWKHPYFVFENIARYTEQIFMNKPIVVDLAHPSYPWISLIFNYTIDIVFSGAILFYFTRPRVKEQFK